MKTRVIHYGVLAWVKTQETLERPQAILRYLKTQSNSSIGEGTPNDPLLIELMDAATLDKSYYDKITASAGPILAEITQSHASHLLMSRQGQPEIELMSLIKEKKILYLGLDSLTNPTIAQAVGKAFLSDLVSTAGKLYKQDPKGNRVNIHCDELAEILQDSFVKILNKAGGAGFQVTAYAQTLQDLEVALESRAKAEMTVGNLNTLIMLRVQNEETAKLLTTRLPPVTVVDHTQVSTVHDKPLATEGELFTTTNEDRLQTPSVPMLEVNDLISLPKGQAFVLMNGGELYKVRISLTP